jgi:hypothetical protein
MEKYLPCLKRLLGIHTKKSFLLLTFVSLALVGCGGGGGGGGGSSVTLQSISITPGDSKIAQGTLKQLTATGPYSDNSTQDLTTTATWSSSDDSIASVDTEGIANNASAATGSTTITATSGTVTGTTTLSATGTLEQKFLVLPLVLDDAPSNPLGPTSMSLFGQFLSTTQFSTTITGDIDGDQYELALWLSIDPPPAVAQRTLTAQLVIDDNGTESEIFETTIDVNTTTPTLYTASIVGTDVDVPSGGTLILKLRGDSTDSGDTDTRIILSSSDTTNNSIEIPPQL